MDNITTDALTDDDRIPSDIVSWEDIPAAETADVEMESERIHITNKEDLYKIDKPVELLPTYVVSDGMDLYTGYNAVVNKTAGAVYYIGKKYMPTQNRNINAMLDRLATEHELSFLSATFDHGETVWHYAKPSATAIFKVGSRELVTTFRLEVRNSYTGSSSLSIRAGGIISYCQNLYGLPSKMVRGGLGINLKARHTSSVNEILEDVERRMPLMIETFDNLHSRKTWNVKPESVIIEDLYKLFPNNALGAKNAAMVGLELARERENWGSADFNWFMALTQATTYPDKFGLKPTAVEAIRRYHDENFLA